MRGPFSTARAVSIFTAAALAAASASAQQPAATKADSSASDKARAQIEACATYKFETSAKVTVDGKTRKMNVKLCGVEAKSDADWVRTLEDAVEKVETNDRFPAEAKEQIVAALQAEIAKYAPAQPAQAILDLPSQPSVALPRPSAQVGPPVEYSALPPLPAPLPAKPAATPAKPGAIRASLPRKPSLDLRCFTPGDLGSGGPCLTLERGTVITIEADEALATGYGLRFLRRGDLKGEITLAQMRRGGSVQLGVPRELCAGVNGSRVELQIVHGSHVLETFGPYDLRC